MLPANPSSVKEEEKPDLHDYVSLNNNWEVNKIIPSVTSMTLAQTISMRKVTRTRERKMLLVYRQKLCRIASGHASSTKEFNNEDTFKKFHEHLDHLTPSHLQLPSFQMTL